MSSNHPILCHPLFLMPSIFASLRVFSKESVLCIRYSQSVGVSASTSVLPMNIQDWFPLGWTDGSPCSPRDSQESSPPSRFKSINSSAKYQFVSAQLSLWASSHMTTGKTIALTRWTFVGQVMSLLFNMMSRLVIAFLAKSKCLFKQR